MSIAAALPTMAVESHGFVNFVNLIPGGESCEIRIDTKNPAPDGLKSGEETGWFMFPAGASSVTIGMVGLKEQKGSLQITEGAGALIVVYLQAPNEPGKDGKPSPPLIRIRSFPTFASDGLALRFISLCPADNRFQIGTLRVELERFKAMEIPKWNGTGFKLRKNGTEVANVPDRREKQPFYLLIADDPSGRHASALVFGGTPQAPPWRLKPKKEPETTESNP